VTSQNTTSADAALAALPEAFRHPHVTAFTIEPHPWRQGAFQAKYQYQPFDGTEDRPERPDGLYGTDLTSEQYEGISDLYNAMLASWAGAQFTAAVRDYLTDADTAWKAWTTAEQALAEAYAAFDGLADGAWRSGRLALHDLQDTLLKAAGDFDGAAGGLARLQESHWNDMRKSIGEITGFDLATSYDDVAATMGISTKGWQIGDAEDYRYSWSTRTLTHRTKETVAEQNERLDRAAKDISAAGEGVLELVGGIRGELAAVRAERDAAAEDHRAELAAAHAERQAAVETAEGRRADYESAVAQWHNADALLAEARQALESDDLHADCAWVADLEAQKDLTKAAWATHDAAAADAKDFRLQRNVILVCGSVIVAVLVVALVVIGSGS
jgi:hypothetical protein